MQPVNFKKDIEVRDNKFHVSLDSVSFQAVMMESKNHNIIYKIDGLHEKFRDVAYSKCQLYLNKYLNRGNSAETVTIHNEETVSDKYPCGADRDNNPIIYIGKAKSWSDLYSEDTGFKDLP